MESLKLKSDTWLVSQEAREALVRAFRANPRRSWWPLESRPSLSNLRGKARDFWGRYYSSRERLFAEARVRVVYFYLRNGEKCGIVTMKYEPLSSAWVRKGRQLMSAAPVRRPLPDELASILLDPPELGIGVCYLSQGRLRIWSDRLDEVIDLHQVNDVYDARKVLMDMFGWHRVWNLLIYDD